MALYEFCMALYEFYSPFSSQVIHNFFGASMRKLLIGVGKPIRTDDKYWYSHNNQYRCCRETTDIEKRQRGGTWKQVSEYHKYKEMHQSILNDFERAIEAKRLFDSALFS